MFCTITVFVFAVAVMILMDNTLQFKQKRRVSNLTKFYLNYIVYALNIQSNNSITATRKMA